MGADEHRAPIEPVFRLAETEFKLFIEQLTDLFPEVDPQIPPLPPKDVIYRIYRDVRPTLFFGNHGIFLKQHRFDSAMTRRLTKPTSPRPSQEAGERVLLLVVSTCMHRCTLRHLTTSPRLDHMYARFASCSILWRFR